MIYTKQILGKRDLQYGYSSPSRGHACPSCNSSNTSFGYELKLEGVPISVWTCFSCLTLFRIIFKDEYSMTLKTVDRNWIWHKKESVESMELVSSSPNGQSCPFCKSTEQFYVRINNSTYQCCFCKSCNTIYYGNYESIRNIVAKEIATIIHEERQRRGEGANEYLETRVIISKLLLILADDNDEWNEKEFLELCK